MSSVDPENGGNMYRNVGTTAHIKTVEHPAYELISTIYFRDGLR
jgi:hypothetical protein